eukprot:CAMPEP_0171167332 /NCGR_PEP_ID=MMETSP0790-20130122/7149_1 /TAXON_ID=2925 /ORGANISM="Alexandrium catenella, Strain OF101" /LENGTH=600 /DNA_ID=CAMNT_0011632155 /DNA_START=32 /DNA_END=1831 /DNA_ORIENTATION=+
MANSVAAMMAMDDGGCRGNGVGMEQTAPNPSVAFNSIGTAPFRESMSRYSAQECAAEDRRKERTCKGLVRFKSEQRVPDVGGLGWRTASGHLLKNQGFYSQHSRVNKWDQAYHAGVNTWKDFHGPKQRSDANTMERLDRYDEDEEYREAQRTYVNTARVQSLDRLYQRKLERVNLEHATSWAPHRHAHRQVHSIHETFDGGMDEKPEKELKKVLTAKVLERDREAVRSIASRVQKEETWKMVWKHMEQERRSDIRTDFRARQAHTDRLMAMSGQPVREQQEHQSVNSCTERNEELARPAVRGRLGDVTALTDFAGLVHTANNAHVLEALLPGAGHEMCEEFRHAATRSAEPGWPPPPHAETPRASKRQHLGASEDEELSLAKPSIPVPTERFEHNIGSRMSPEVLARHSKVQFLKTSAPPPPDQSETLLREDWSPAATLGKTGGKAEAHGFSRTTTSMPFHGQLKEKAKESHPAPTRSYVYPVICEISPRSPASPSSSKMWQETPDSALQRMRRNESAPGDLLRSGGKQRPRRGSESGGGGEREAAMRAVCDELDDFEASLGHFTKPNMVNFFGTPQGTGGGVRLKASLRRTTSKTGSKR